MAWGGGRGRGRCGRAGFGQRYHGDQRVNRYIGLQHLPARRLVEVERAAVEPGADAADARAADDVNAATFGKAFGEELGDAERT